MKRATCKKKYLGIPCAERGDGPWILILFLVGLGVLWFVGDLIIGWIYTTKENRVEEAHGRGKRELSVTPTPTLRELGSYTVEFNK